MTVCLGNSSPCLLIYELQMRSTSAVLGSLRLSNFLGQMNPETPVYTQSTQMSHEHPRDNLLR